MDTKIKIQASYFKSSRKDENKKEELFRLFEFNYPLNPFRVTGDETRMHLKHAKFTDVNEGIIGAFEHLLERIAEALSEEKKNIEEMSCLAHELDHEIKIFSTMPCTSNIDTQVFEHLNYVLQLLYRWQDYAAVVRKIEENNDTFLEKVIHQFKVSPEEAKIEINEFKKKYARQTTELLLEIKEIKAALQEEHFKDK